MKLKYRLDRWGRAVLFQVIKMDESFRAKTGDHNRITTSALNVESVSKPELTKNIIYLHGSSIHEDDYVCVLEFSTPEEAQEYVDKVNLSLKEWADKWFNHTLNRDGNTFTI